MTSRAQAVEALLRTLNLWLPGPSTNCSPAHSRPDSGEAPSLTVVCEICQGEGHARGNLCGSCRGHGVRILDAYTEREVSTVDRPAPPRVRLVKCDSCGGQGVYGNGKRCRYCDGSGSVQVARETSWEASGRDAGTGVRVTVDSAFPERRADLMRRGSYVELEAALLTLERRFPVLHRAAVKYLVDEWPAAISPPLRSLLDEACERLADLMPTRIRVPRWAQDAPKPKGQALNGHSRGRRNEEIRRLREQGLSAAKIGGMVGLAKRSVNRILSG